MRVGYGLFVFVIEPKNTDNVQVYIFQLNKKEVFLKHQGSWSLIR